MAALLMNRRGAIVVPGVLLGLLALPGCPGRTTPATDAAPGSDATASDSAIASDAWAPPDAGGGTDAGPAGPPANKFGIGLVGPGNATQWDRAAELAGPGGHVKLIFAGVDLGMTAPAVEWSDAITNVYARDLVPVIRMAPPWGDRDVRSRSDDAAHRSYVGLAAAYAAVTAGLPLRPGWPLVVEVHNEPNLCYEWVCNPADAPPNPAVPAGWMHYTDTAAEYASFLRDVNDAVSALGDPRLLVVNGGLAPGGAVSCECGGAGFNAGVTSLDFLTAMEAAVPGVHAALDGFASHSYPAEGAGWGFFVAYASAGLGLHFYEMELATLGLALPVYITETGWTTAAGAFGTREQIADWTRSAFELDWLPDPEVAAVMPFMLQDPAWEPFAWVDGANVPYPVFGAVRDLRCLLGIPGPC